MNADDHADSSRTDYQEWYAAEILLEVTVENDPRIVSQIETYLIQAESSDAAYDSATEIGKSLDYSYRNSDGQVVTMAYRGIHELDNIEDVPAHGCQIAVRQSLVGESADIENLVRPKGQLSVFREEECEFGGPNLSQR